MTRVLLAGDTHSGVGEARAAVTWALKKNVELIIQLGDFAFNFPTEFMEIWEEAPVPVYFLRGNHDNTHTIEDKWGPIVGREPRTSHRYPNVSFLPDGCTIKIGDSRVAVLGGAVSIDRHMRGSNGWWAEEPTQSSAVMDLIFRGYKADVLLCHDVPATPPEIEHLLRGYKDDPCSTTNRMMLRRAYDSLQPARVFHGHYHHPYTETYDGAVFQGLDMDGPAALAVVEF